MKLDRDSCKECIALKGKVNSLGQQIYCSQAHAHEESNIKKLNYIEESKKELFDTIYQLGKSGAKVKYDSPEIKKMLDDLENTWY
jgi:hypothetical protein